MVFLLVKYGRILQTYFSKTMEDAQIIFVFTFILFYHFRFHFFDNYFHFHLALKVDKISKMIIENQKLSFSFSSLRPRLWPSFFFSVLPASVDVVVLQLEDGLRCVNASLPAPAAPGVVLHCGAYVFCSCARPDYPVFWCSSWIDQITLYFDVSHE